MIILKILVGIWCALSLATMTICAFAPLWIEEEDDR